jgi:hypothetical protein
LRFDGAIMLTATDIRTPALRRLLGDWQERRRGREFPARADFDPADLKYLLGSLALIDVEQDPPRFRFRLHGSRIGQRVGYDMTGKPVDTLPPAVGPLVLRHFAAVMEARAPRVEIRERALIDDGIADCEVLVLPLSRDGAEIDMLLVGMSFS